MPMNAAAQAETDSLCLVEIIELKWLLTGHGMNVHVEQLQTDREYARDLLDRAAAIPNRALQDAADRVRACLRLSEGPSTARRVANGARAA